MLDIYKKKNILKIITDINQFPKLDYPVVTIGRFDGVHLGHKKLIERLKNIAKKNLGQTVIITFSPSPEEVLYASEGKNIRLLNIQQEKEELLQNLGIDYLLVLPFTESFSRITSENFILDYLVDKIHLKELVVGFSHNFGYGREGDFLQLNSLGKKCGFRVNEIPMEDIRKRNITAVKIRKFLKDGLIKEANELLGYPYSISGKVIKGNQIGRTIGYPTANIDVKDTYKNKLIPKQGVYAVLIRYQENTYRGMANIGYRPTLKLEKHELTTEVYIFNFSGEIYDKKLTIYFVERIRDEVKFDSLENLKTQLKKDENRSLQLLAGY
ncbi:MAG: riboflavin biosynthesis protein RibF [Bacteroidetes bacterium]|nr:MAG: riboflavin biosynthesis protein RibF [Bacteroidota bacterium]